MSKMNGYQCDRNGCGATGMTEWAEGSPKGWVTMFGPGTPPLHCCSWVCAAVLLADDEPNKAPGGSVARVGDV